MEVRTEQGNVAWRYRCMMVTNNLEHKAVLSTARGTTYRFLSSPTPTSPYGRKRKTHIQEQGKVPCKKLKENSQMPIRWNRAPVKKSALNRPMQDTPSRKYRKTYTVKAQRMWGSARVQEELLQRSSMCCFLGCLRRLFGDSFRSWRLSPLRDDAGAMALPE